MGRDQTPSSMDGRTGRTSDTAWFFCVALGFTGLLQLPAALAYVGVLPGGVQAYMAPAALGTFGPLLAAILAARREVGGAGARALLRDVVRPPAQLLWLPIALGACTLAHVAGVLAYRLGGGQDAVSLLYMPESGQHWAALVLIPLVEEPGWRGFALPRLLRAYKPLSASLRLGVLWAAWHVLMFLVQGMTPGAFMLALLNIVAGSVLFGWLYMRSGHNLCVAVVAHAGAHLNNPTRALGTSSDGLTAFAIYTAALCVAGVLLVLLDRRAWRS